MPWNPLSPVQQASVTRLASTMRAAMQDGREWSRADLMRLTRCGDPHRMTSALAQLERDGIVAFRLSRTSAAGTACGPRLYRLAHVQVAPMVVRVPKDTTPAPRGRLYGGCPCGCTPRVIGYYTDPARSWLSGPVLGCGRGEAAA